MGSRREDRRRRKRNRARLSDPKVQDRLDVMAVKRLAKGTVTAPEEPDRNDRCPCASGRKYKKCCGANKEQAIKFIVYHPKTNAARQDEEGKIKVWSTFKGARKELMELIHRGVETWKIGGMGGTRWRAFRDTYGDDKLALL